MGSQDGSCTLSGDGRSCDGIGILLRYRVRRGGRVLNNTSDGDRQLSPDALRWTCNPGELDFATTADLPPGEAIVGHGRALHAFEFGLTVKPTRL